MCEIHDNEEQEMAPKSVSEFVDELVVALTNARIYAPGHPRVISTLNRLHVLLGQLTDFHTRPALVLGSADGYLFHERRPLLGASLSAKRVIEALERITAGGLYVDHRATPDELLTLVEVLGQGERGPKSHIEANEMLNQSSATHVRFLAEYGDGMPDVGLLELATGTGQGPAFDGGADSAGDDDLEIQTTSSVTLPHTQYQRVVHGLQEVMVDATRGGSVRIDTAQDLVEGLLQALAEDPKSLMGICRYERYDAFTFGHSIRVCSLALLFASRVIDDPAIVRRVGAAALLHDVGKARVPFEILYARGRLTPEERDEMSRHTEYGGDILLDAASTDPAAVACAFGHHTHLGSLEEEGRVISVITRLVKICDVFEALTAVRPYKDRMHPVRAYRIMLTMKGHFDLALLHKFIEINGVYPVGYPVVLTDGSTGRVQAQTGDLRRPIVDLEKKPFGRTEDRIDLSKHGGAEPLEVKELVGEPQLGVV